MATLSGPAHLWQVWSVWNPPISPSIAALAQDTVSLRWQTSARLAELPTLTHTDITLAHSIHNTALLIDIYGQVLSPTVFSYCSSARSWSEMQWNMFGESCFSVVLCSLSPSLHLQLSLWCFCLYCIIRIYILLPIPTLYSSQYWHWTAVFDWFRTPLFIHSDFFSLGATGYKFCLWNSISVKKKKKKAESRHNMMVFFVYWSSKV